MPEDLDPYRLHEHQGYAEIAAPRQSTVGSFLQTGAKHAVLAQPPSLCRRRPTVLALHLPVPDRLGQLALAALLEQRLQSARGRHRLCR